MPSAAIYSYRHHSRHASGICDLLSALDTDVVVSGTSSRPLFARRLPLSLKVHPDIEKIAPEAYQRMRVLHLKHLDTQIEHEVMKSFAFGSKYFPPYFLTQYIMETNPNTLMLGTPREAKPLGLLPTHLHDVYWAKSSHNSKQLCREAWDYVIGKGLKLKDKFSDVALDLWPKHTVVDPSTNIPIQGHNKQLPWIVTVPLPFIEGIYDTSVHHLEFPFSSLFLSMTLKLCCRTVTMFLFLCEHHTSDATTRVHTSTNHNLHAAIHAGHVCEDHIQTHKPLYILSHAYVNVRSCLSTVQNTLASFISQKHSPNGPVHTIRQIRRRLRTILQGHLESTLVPTRCIPALTPSCIIPWCVSLATTYPQPGHVSLGTTSLLLLESCFQ